MGGKVFIFSILLDATRLLFKIAILFISLNPCTCVPIFHMPKYVHYSGFYQWVKSGIDLICFFLMISDIENLSKH